MITAREFAFLTIATALSDNNGLAAEVSFPVSPVAIELRNFLKLTPKQYRKMLVGLTNVVETQMCDKDWDNINFNHVPSAASSRYKKVFCSSY